MPFLNVIFLQDHHADEALRIEREEGPVAAIAYLAQWDNGDRGEVREERNAGSADDVYYDDDGYILTWNAGLGYIGLEREVPCT